MMAALADSPSMVRARNRS